MSGAGFTGNDVYFPEPVSMVDLKTRFEITTNKKKDFGSLRKVLFFVHLIDNYTFISVSGTT